ncbi:MAG: LEA type 2 family protein [Treponema sp.]|jgi:LEA14-like dessication related protein|nr:LEA type 2 family protein [Treponema sp.]
MKKPEYSLWILALFFLVLGWSCKTPAPPTLEETPENPWASISLDRIGARDLNQVNLEFTLEADNPRSSPAEVRIGNYKAVINGKETNDGIRFYTDQEKTAFPVSPAAGGPGSTEIPLLLELDIARLTAMGLSLEHDYQVTLTVDVEFVYPSGAPVHVSARGLAVFPRIQEPVFTITAIAVLKAELINTRFRVTMKVDNPNPFPMELSAFNYDLYGDGRLWADGTEKNVLRIPAADSAATQLFLIMNFTNMKRPMLDRIVALEDVNYRFAGDVQVTTGMDYLPRFRSDFDLSGYSKVYEN